VLKYLAREFLLIVSTSSSESALPRLIAKMEHLGVAKPHRRHRGTHRLLVQPGRHCDLPDHVVAVHRVGDGRSVDDSPADSLLLFMMLASKGVAGVTGAGLATLAGGLASHRPDLVEGVGRRAGDLAV
jgi:aerobic C4-dicarboxylate transport protein